MPFESHVYIASLRDKQPLLHLLRTARRSFAAFGEEDLPRLLASGDCLVALSGDHVWAMLCATPSRAPWAFLRGAVIADGWRASEALAALLEPLMHRLRLRGLEHLAMYGTALWLVPLLLRAGFERIDWIITLERHPRPLPAQPADQVVIRTVSAHDLPELSTLDTSVFEPPYQLASGELIEYMVTTGYFVVATQDEHLVGYACADVMGSEGQIIRLAVHPDTRRQGVGRALLNGALTYCQANGARSVIVNTQESNQASLTLYEGMGFRRVGQRIPVLVRALS